MVFPSRNRGDRTENYNRSRPYDGRANGQFSQSPVRFGTPPLRSNLNDQIRRTYASPVYRDQYRRHSSNNSSFAFGGVFGGLRVGYVSYGNDWGRYRGGYFGYSNYVYDPYVTNTVVVASPWYGYSYLPPYLDTTRVIVVHDYPNWRSDNWSTYDYQYDARNRRNEALSDSLDNLRDAFERNSVRYAERLVPQDGQVAIFNDGKYDYSTSADDFDKIFLDGIEQSKTSRYEILEVRTQGDEVHVRSRHEFEDSWGERQVAEHMLTLRRERGGNYVIREFGTR